MSVPHRESGPPAGVAPTLVAAPSSLARRFAVSSVRPEVLGTMCLLLLLSGAAGLMYQVAWVRLLGLSLGVTVYAISTVLAAFMGGLALGSVLGGRWADRVRRPLLTYGLIEIGIGALGLLTPLAFAGLQEVYRAVAQVADSAQAPLAAGMVRTTLAFGVLLVPTALMGASLPLAVRGARRSADVGSDSLAMSALYALNTTGAIAGTLAAGFVLIGRFGIGATIAAAAVANVLAGCGAIALSAAVREGQRPATSAGGGRAQVASPPEARGATASAGDRRLARAAFWAFGLSGALSFAYEVVWSRVLAVLFDSSIYGFVLMLATVLAGIAVGSAVAGALVSRWPSARLAGSAFGWVEVGIGIGAVFSLAAFGVAYEVLLGLREADSALLVRIVRTEPRLMALLCVLTVLPAALLIGATFPLAARLWAAGNDRLGARLGGIYAANVAGAIVGSLGAGFLLVPLVGAHASLLLLAVANVLLGIWLLWLTAHAPVGAHRAAPARRALPARAPLVGGVVGLTLVGWAATQPPLHTQVFRQKYADHQVLWYREGLENTVTVAQRPDSVRVLITNSRSQTTDEPGQVRYHRLIGHMAALLAPQRERVLVVGLGGGATPGAIAQHPGTHVDVVELSDAVVAAAPYFREVNAGLLERPNVTLAIDDGRNHLLRAREAYDIITADIIMPEDAGATNLYSAEYFRLAAQALSEDGVMVQWVPPVNGFVHATITRSFLEAFPYATLWLGHDLLIGSHKPLQVDSAELARRFGEPGVREALAEVGFHTPEDVLAQFRGDTTELRAYVGQGPILSDDRPLLEYFRSWDLPHTPLDLAPFTSDLSKVLVP